MRLLLARHGESVWNAEKRFQGHTDIELSARGRAQAEALGRALRGYRVTAAYVSPFHRARETAELALRELGAVAPPVTEDRDGSAGAVPSVWGSGGHVAAPSIVEELRELSLGAWEGCTVEEVRAQAGDPYRAWLRAPHDCPPPGAEPLPVVSDRVRAAIDRIARDHGPGEDVLIVSHGGVISVYACHLLGCSFNQLWQLRVDNASLTVVRPPRIVSLNDTAHLQGDLAPAHLQRPSIAARSEAAP
jgi:broad specificity phosphatase PhoE